jgi:hypothetical protein
LKYGDSTISTGTFELMLEEYAGPAKMGYGRNPYDTVPNVRDPSSTARYANLRRLSEWIRTKKQVEQLKYGERPKDSDEDPSA